MCSTAGSRGPGASVITQASSCSAACLSPELPDKAACPAGMPRGQIWNSISEASQILSGCCGKVDWHSHHAGQQLHHGLPVPRAA